jgi:hypothetical protein
MNERQIDQLSAVYGGRKSNLVCFASELDIDASNKKK